MKDVGLAGLPASGKSTLFTALTRAGASGGRANQAVVPVPDPRLGVLAEMERSAKVVPAQVRFLDVPGGLSAQGLATLRTADALALVIGAFQGESDPAADLEAVRSELMLADLTVIEGAEERAGKRARTGRDPDAAASAAALARARQALDAGRPLREIELSDEERVALRDFGFLSLKPWIVVANLEEGASIPDGLPEGTVGVFAAIEAEVAEMDQAEGRALLEEFGVEEPGLEAVIEASYAALDLITFLTTGEDETRAWQVRQGAKAPEAAGAIHSDLERGFIRAEVIGYEELVSAGSEKEARARGLVRTEGKEYVVQEGDVLHVLFSV
jgi:ribosome-binding ATPase YchF (GTP1/OBG family)